MYIYIHIHAYAYAAWGYIASKKGELLKAVRTRFTRWIFRNGPDPGNVVAPRPEQFLALCVRPHLARILPGIIMRKRREINAKDIPEYTK